jgi:hypothetical protein
VHRALLLPERVARSRDMAPYARGSLPSFSQFAKHSVVRSWGPMRGGEATRGGCLRSRRGVNDVAHLQAHTARLTHGNPRLGLVVRLTPVGFGLEDDSGLGLLFSLRGVREAPTEALSSRSTRPRQTS